MPKLIVEEGGKRRTFRLGHGILTVGSGAEARLKLTAPDVAEVHLELDVGAAGVTLRPRPGVLAPRVVGVPVKGELALALGKKVELAGVRLWLEADDAPASESAAAAPSTSAAALAGPAPARVAPATNASTVPASRPAARPNRERAPREPRSGGAPGWLVPVLVVLALAVVGLLVVRSWTKGGEADSGRAFNLIQAAIQERGAGNYDLALAKLAAIPEDAFTPELKAKAEELTKQYLADKALDQLELKNRSGDKYFDVLLERYEANYLQGTPSPSKVRLFLKRCATFRQRWPSHSKLEWVARQEERFKGYVDMSAPPSWPDVEWEVRDLVDGMPRKYKPAFALLDELLSRTEGQERGKVQARRDELAKERPEYAQDRLFQARHEFEKKQDTAKAIWWLMNNIAWLGDEALEDESARFLIKMPDLPAHLRGYAVDYPDMFADVMRNSVVAAWAERTGFKP